MDILLRSSDTNTILFNLCPVSSSLVSNINPISGEQNKEKHIIVLSVPLFGSENICCVADSLDTRNYADIQFRPINPLEDAKLKQSSIAPTTLLVTL